MRSTYRVLAYAIPVLVAVQAAAIALGVFGLTHWIEDGNDVTKSVVDNNSSRITGSAGFGIHAIDGTMIIPLVALVLLIVSFFAKIPGGTKWALFVLGDVILQILLAYTAFGVPVVGMLHGVNALILAGLGITAAARINRVTTEAQPEMAA
jgi:hypothetical protein